MKAISPTRSLSKSSSAGASDQNLGISRSKSPADDALGLLYNMNDCYSKLKELVPSLPSNKSVSKMEILQHVIDYILDLQIALDSHSSAAALQRHQRQGQAAARTPLSTLNRDLSCPHVQAAEFPKELSTDDRKTLFH